MHCQRATTKAVIDKKADYILVVKGDQSTLTDELDKVIENALIKDNPEISYHHKREINRGREVYRSVSILPCSRNSSVFSDWAGLETIGVICRSLEINGVIEESEEILITSPPCKVRDISKRIRKHLGCEKSEYYVVDIAFTEEASQIRKGTSPKISLTFRRPALSNLRQDNTMRDSILAKRKIYGWDNTT